MTDEKYSIASLNDWLKKTSASFFNQREAKLKTITPCEQDFFPPFEQVKGTVIVRNSDWFIALFAPVVIGWRNYFWYWFFYSHLKTVIIIAVMTLQHRTLRAVSQPSPIFAAVPGAIRLRG